MWGSLACSTRKYRIAGNFCEHKFSRITNKYTSPPCAWNRLFTEIHWYADKSFAVLSPLLCSISLVVSRSKPELSKTTWTAVTPPFRWGCADFANNIVSHATHWRYRGGLYQKHPFQYNHIMYLLRWKIGCDYWYIFVPFLQVAGCIRNNLWCLVEYAMFFD